MVIAEPLAPSGEILAQRFTEHGALVEFDSMPLPVIETNRLDPFITVERQGKTSRRILAAGEQHKSPSRDFAHRAMPLPIPV
jgi:hypothetical protein